MYAVCISDSMNLTDNCIRWCNSYSEAEACRDRWGAHYGYRYGLKILDCNGVVESKKRNRFRDVSDPNN